MRIINPTNNLEFYLSGIKDNKPPRHLSRVRPVNITIEKQTYDCFSNPNKSNYAYILFGDKWLACRDHRVAHCGAQNLIILNMGRPYKPRSKDKPVQNAPVIDIAVKDQVIKPLRFAENRPIIVIKKEQHIKH